MGKKQKDNYFKSHYDIFLKINTINGKKFSITAKIHLQLSKKF